MVMFFDGQTLCFHQCTLCWLKGIFAINGQLKTMESLCAWKISVHIIYVGKL